MAVFPVRRFGDPVLRKPAGEVTSIDSSIEKLVRDLRDTMADAAGVGLAAPQIGVSKRVIVWRTEDDEGALVNPLIADSRGEVEGEEGCLSIPGLYYPVRRAEWVEVHGIHVDGRSAKFEASGFMARVIQHEIDHLDGILFIDRLQADVAREAKRLLREQAFSGASPSHAPAL